MRVYHVQKLCLLSKTLHAAQKNKIGIWPKLGQDQR